ncbi:MAG: hypothetical protein NVS3B16_07020 [Vulcanimicrobiaceae bacterium]
MGVEFSEKLGNDFIRQPERLTKPNCIAAATVLILSLALAWPIFARTGIPSLHHDWSWPADAAQARAQARSAVSPVIPDNFGSLNFYQFNAPFWALVAGGETFFGGAVALRLLLVIVLGGGGIAVFHFLRSAFDAGPIAAAAGAVLYITNAAVANRLGAGHLTYLVAYMMFPLIVWQFVRIARGRSAPAWIALIAIVPLAIVHPQFLVFPAIAAFIIVPFVSANRRAPLLLAALLPLILSPFTLAVALTGSPATDLSFERTTLHWQFANSAPLREALELSNGPHGYDQLAPEALRDLRALAMGTLWLLALVGAVRFARVRPFFFVAAFGLAMQWGLRGPLSAPLGFFYTHYIAASLFRELYHFAVFSALGLCICAISAFPRAGAFAFVLALFQAAPQYSGAYFGGIAFETDRDIAAVSKIVSADGRPGYVAFVPMLQPVGPDPAHAGDDPQAFQFPGHATLHEFMPQAPLVQIDLALRADPGNAAAILASYGVRYVVVRPNWQSYYESSQEPELLALLKSHPAIPQQIAAIGRHLHVVWRGDHTWLARIDEPAAFVHGPPLSPLRRHPTEAFVRRTPIVTNPMDGWADSLRWFWWSPRNTDTVNPGLITASETPLALETNDDRATVYAWTTGRASIVSAAGTAAVRGDVAAYRTGRGLVTVLPARGAVTGFAGVGAAASEAPRVARDGRCTSIAGAAPVVVAVDARCADGAVEVLANRSLGYVFRGRDGAPVAPDPTRWDAQFVVPKAGGSIENPVLAAMVRLEFVQYAAWALSFGALGLAVSGALRRYGNGGGARFPR